MVHFPEQRDSEGLPDLEQALWFTCHTDELTDLLGIIKSARDFACGGIWPDRKVMQHACSKNGG